MEPLLERALEMLERTSRTFYIPIQRLPPGLMEAVGSAYLCLRAIDEIEDHPTLKSAVKEKLLRNISQTLQASAEEIQAENLLITLERIRGISARGDHSAGRLGEPGAA